jgi:hypothetical protein
MPVHFLFSKFAVFLREYPPFCWQLQKASLLTRWFNHYNAFQYILSISLVDTKPHNHTARLANKEQRISNSLVSETMKPNTRNTRSARQVKVAQNREFEKEFYFYGKTIYWAREWMNDKFRTFWPIDAKLASFCPGWMNNCALIQPR